jgi:hypothetical protein
MLPISDNLAGSIQVLSSPIPWKQMPNYCSCYSSTFVFILSHTNAVNTLPLYVFKVHFNINLSLCQVLQSGLFLSNAPIKIVYVCSFSSAWDVCTDHIILLFDEDYKSWPPSLRSFYSFLLRPPCLALIFSVAIQCWTPPVFHPGFVSRN